jgi:hypothetical protein
MLTDAEPFRNLRYPIPALGDLGHRITLELIAEIGLPSSLPVLKIRIKASRNLGAIRLSDHVCVIPFVCDEFSGGRQAPDTLLGNGSIRDISGT